MKRLVVMASGNGSNLQAILDRTRVDFQELGQEEA